jgi:ribonuclease D
VTDAQQTAEAATGLATPEPSGPAPVPLLAPREGIPPVVTDARDLEEVVAAFAAGHGPVAVDAERASGYRYGQRAYLV